MVEKSITGIVTWLKNWFYDSDQVDTFLNSKANKNLGTAGMNVVTDASGEISLEAKPTIPTVPSASSTTPSADTSSGAVGTGTTWARADHEHPKSSIYADANHDHTVSEITDFPSTMTPSSHTHGNLSNDGKVGSNANYFVTTTTGGAITSKQKIGNINTNGQIGSTANLPLITTTNGAITTGTFGNSANTFCEGNDSRLSDARTPTAHSHEDNDINVDDDNFTNIASLLGIPTSYFTTQDKANYCIDQAFAQISGIKALEFVQTLPTASASTMNMLYVINENQKINFYWTYDKGESYNPRYIWEKMDTDILDELVVNWSDVQNKPNTFTPSSHSHGQITNDGKITSTTVTVASGDNILITDASDSSKVKRVANLLADHIQDGTAHSNIGSSANDTQSTINTKIDTSLGNKISKSSTATGLLKDDGTVMTSGTGSSNWAVGNHTHSTYGLKTDDIDWDYNSNGFVNGIKLHDKTATGDDATGTITFHLKS